MSNLLLTILLFKCLWPKSVIIHVLFETIPRMYLWCSFGTEIELEAWVWNWTNNSLLAFKTISFFPEIKKVKDWSLLEDISILAPVLSITVLMILWFLSVDPPPKCSEAAWKTVKILVRIRVCKFLISRNPWFHLMNF